MFIIVDELFQFAFWRMQVELPDFVKIVIVNLQPKYRNDGAFPLAFELLRKPYCGKRFIDRVEWSEIQSCLLTRYYGNAPGIDEFFNLAGLDDSFFAEFIIKCFGSWL